MNYSMSCTYKVMEVPREQALVVASCIMHVENFKSSCSRVRVCLQLLTDLFCSTSNITPTFENCSGLPMLLPLILQIVLVGNLLNHSSCLEGVKELSHKEPSTSNTRGNLENLANVITGELLTGYYSDIQYTGAACDVIRYAKSYQLNVCTPSMDGSSFQVLANSTHTATYVYSDNSCATLSSTSIKPDALQICGKSFKTHSVTADHSSVTISSSAPLLSAA